MTAWLVLFAASVGMLAYTLVGFPLLVLVKAWLLPRPLALSGSDEPPTVTVLIAAYNEEACIEGKLDRLLESNYPRDRYEVIVVSDGSTDATNSMVTSYPADNVRLVAVDRLGKAAALNHAAPLATGEVLVFTDANSMFANDALAELVAPFRDPSVGGVAGDQRYLKPDRQDESASSAGERGYWSLDRWLKEIESRTGNTISATGAIYAIRRRLFRGAPEGVTDDFAISTDVIAQGYRLVFAGEAAAYEPVAASSKLEFGRKVRVMSRGFRSVWLRRELLNPFRHGFYSIQLFSHKVLRRMLTFPLLGLLIASVALWDAHPAFPALAILQLSFYALAGVPLLVPRRYLPRGLTLPFFICMVNAAAVLALVRTLRGGRITLWETHRLDDPTKVESARVASLSSPGPQIGEATQSPSP